jgi:NADH-quinone oxidoreductase subunit L
MSSALEHSITNLLLAITLLPLLSAALLMLAPSFSIRLPKFLALTIGAGSVGAAAICAAIINFKLYGVDNFSISASFANWMTVADFSIAFGFYLDPLSLVMTSIVTGVGFLIHLYSTGFMNEDKDYQRFFAYLNLFVAAMLILVLADNMLLLFLGWEGVGLCSFLLIGFWHSETNNILAANKAFIMTRVGDTGLALGLFLLFYQLGTLNIQAMQTIAEGVWSNDSTLATITCLLLLMGAVGKSGQIPLQSWLPDAMAGPTPVSALIHAATMVTAGVYLIARCHGLFELSPFAMHAIALIGAATLFVAASAALVQTDVKRILAYSTVSQIGYMFLALGAGAYSAAVFHLMTHAFFKALLFLSAGALIYCMHHEHNIFRMGGLAKKLPIICACFAIGCAALASLPLTSGFFSKEMILEKLLEKQMYGFWYIAIAGAFLTAFYSFRLFFVIFLGECKHSPDKQPGFVMTLPLIILAILAACGGRLPQGLKALFDNGEFSSHHANTGILIFTIAVPLVAVAFSFMQFKRGLFHKEVSASLKPIHDFLYSGWGFDWLYKIVLVKPYIFITSLNQHDVFDRVPALLVAVSRGMNTVLNQSQNGQLRWYSASLVAFCIAALTWVLLT